MFWFFGVERKWSASLERFTITRIEKNTRTCFLQGWIGLPLPREKSAVRCSVLRGSHVEKRHSNSGKFQSRSNRANIYELFLKRKEKKAKESKPRTKELDEEYIIPRNEKIYTDESSSLSRRETTNDSFVRGKANWSVGGEKPQR